MVPLCRRWGAREREADVTLAEDQNARSWEAGGVLSLSAAKEEKETKGEKMRGGIFVDVFLCLFLFYL